MTAGGPTAEEAADYEDSKNHDAGHDRNENDGDGEIDGMVDPGTLRLVEETDEFWLFAFVPTDDMGGDDEDDDIGRKMLEAMVGTVRIAKDGRHLEFIDIHNTKPLRPKTGVKLKKFLTRMTFGPAVDGGPVVMKSMDVAIKLSAFLVIRINETESVRFSDFEAARETG